MQLQDALSHPRALCLWRILCGMVSVPPGKATSICSLP